MPTLPFISCETNQYFHIEVKHCNAKEIVQSRNAARRHPQVHPRLSDKGKKVKYSESTISKHVDGSLTAWALKMVIATLQIVHFVPYKPVTLEIPFACLDKNAPQQCYRLLKRIVWLNADFGQGWTNQ